MLHGPTAGVHSNISWVAKGCGARVELMAQCIHPNILLCLDPHLCYFQKWCTLKLLHHKGEKLKKPLIIYQTLIILYILTHVVLITAVGRYSCSYLADKETEAQRD